MNEAVNLKLLLLWIESTMNLVQLEIFLVAKRQRTESVSDIRILFSESINGKK